MRFAEECQDYSPKNEETGLNTLPLRPDETDQDGGKTGEERRVRSGLFKVASAFDHNSCGSILVVCFPLEQRCYGPLMQRHCSVPEQG